MTVHEFMQEFVFNVGSVDMADTDILIRTPSGYFKIRSFDWEELDEDTLIMDAVPFEPME